MKIIVDKMPNEPKECLFKSKTYTGNYVCKFQGECVVCNTQKCNYLQAIADFSFEREVSDGRQMYLLR